MSEHKECFNRDLTYLSGDLDFMQKEIKWEMEKTGKPLLTQSQQMLFSRIKEDVASLIALRGGE